MPGKRYASALANNGDRYGNTAVYSKSFVHDSMQCDKISRDADKRTASPLGSLPPLWGLALMLRKIGVTNSEPQ